MVFVEGTTVYSKNPLSYKLYVSNCEKEFISKQPRDSFYIQKDIEGLKTSFDELNEEWSPEKASKVLELVKCLIEEQKTNHILVEVVRILKLDNKIIENVYDLLILNCKELQEEQITNDYIRLKLKQNYSERRKFKEMAESRGIKVLSLRTKKSKPSISALPETQIETKSSKALLHLTKDLEALTNSVKKVAEILNKFGASPQLDTELAQGINEFRPLIIWLGEFFADIGDLRTTYSVLEWLKILSTAEKESIGRASNLTKVEFTNENGELERRGLTKKQIKKGFSTKEKQVNELIRNLEAIGNLFTRLSKWKNASEAEGGTVLPKIQRRKFELHEVLSEAA